MNQKKFILGTQSAMHASSPAKVSNNVVRMKASALPSTSNTGGCFQLVADSGPVYPGGKDTCGVRGTGFKLTDFFTQSTIDKFDYVKVINIEYVASLSNMPRQAVPNVHIYSSIDWDSADMTDFPDFMERSNRSLTVLSTAAPTQKLVDFMPRRRIGSNPDNSLQIVSSPGEWLNCRYASSYIFGNLKLGILAPDGQAQYAVSDQGSALVTAVLQVEFKGRVNA